MGFHIDTRNVPRLLGFSQALQHHKSIVPIRGSGANSGIRPLNRFNRNTTHMSIRHEDGVVSPLGNSGQAVFCKLYRTDCVTYYQDGSVRLNTDGYSRSVSTRMFINSLYQWGGVQSCKGDSAAMLYVKGKAVHRFYNHIELDVNGEPIHPHPCTVHVLNRKAFNEVKKLYAPFLQYTAPLIKLAYPQSREEMGKYFKPPAARLLRGSLPVDDAETICLIMRHDNKEDWADLLEELANKHAVTRTYWVAHGQWQKSYTYRPDRMHKAMLEAMKYEHSDAVFVATQLPLGQWKEDRNIKYV